LNNVFLRENKHIPKVLPKVLGKRVTSSENDVEVKTFQTSKLKTLLKRLKGTKQDTTLVKLEGIVAFYVSNIP